MNIAVCVVAKGNSELVKFTINNALQKTFLFANYYFNCDAENFDFCKSIADRTEGGVIQTNGSISQRYNELLLKKVIANKSIKYCFGRETLKFSLLPANVGLGESLTVSVCN